MDVFHEPPFFPIIDDGSNSLWVYPFGKGSTEGFVSGCGVHSPLPCLADLDILRPPEVPTASLHSRRLKLLLETAGVRPGHTGLVDLWITRDNWNWHLFQQSLQTDSLQVDLPDQGRYGLRLVVHDVDMHASPSPRAGEAPQLWVEVDESLPVIGTPKRRVLDGNVYLSHEGIDLRGEAKPAKNGGVGNPRTKIVRVDAEKVEEVKAPEPEPGFFFPNMSGWQR